MSVPTVPTMSTMVRIEREAAEFAILVEEHGEHQLLPILGPKARQGWIHHANGWAPLEHHDPYITGWLARQIWDHDSEIRALDFDEADRLISMAARRRDGWIEIGLGDEKFIDRLAVQLEAALELLRGRGKR